MRNNKPKGCVTMIEDAGFGFVFGLKFKLWHLSFLLASPSSFRRGVGGYKLSMDDVDVHI